MTFLLATSLLVGCAAENAAPVISPLTDQRVDVGSELRIVVGAADAEGDALVFSFAADNERIESAATLDASAAMATLVWTPTADDVGLHTFDFIVSDGLNEVSETVSVTVGAPGKTEGRPVFVRPLGSGTTLDMEDAQCVMIDVEVEDANSTEVELGAQKVAGARLTQTGPLTGELLWCPTDDQIADSDRHTVQLYADDSEGAPITKDFLIVLQGALDNTCDGDSPIVDHTPANLDQTGPIDVQATISDDLGLKYEPLLYFSDSPLGPDPDLSSMTQVTMQLDSGDMKDGVWTAQLPNPVADQPGASADIYYVIVAQDADADGCSHFTQAPTPGSHQLTVTNSTQTNTCVDDAGEEDDDAASARLVDLDAGVYTSADNAICSADDDWYSVLMYNGETLYVGIDFLQATSDEDLDILIYKDGVNLTGCDESNPFACDSLNGQSATSNENMAWTITETGTYHVVIRGWAGAENQYDMCMGLSASDC